MKTLKFYQLWWPLFEGLSTRYLLFSKFVEFISATFYTSSRNLTVLARCYWLLAADIKSSIITVPVTLETRLKDFCHSLSFFSIFELFMWTQAFSLGHYLLRKINSVIRDYFITLSSEPKIDTIQAIFSLDLPSYLALTKVLFSVLLHRKIWSVST